VGEDDREAGVGWVREGGGRGAGGYGLVMAVERE